MLSLSEHSYDIESVEIDLGRLFHRTTKSLCTYEKSVQLKDQCNVALAANQLDTHQQSMRDHGQRQLQT